MRAARFHPPRSIRVEEIPAPRPDRGGILVRVDACGLCGSDVGKFLHGKAAPGEVLGHEVSGFVEEVGPDAPVPANGARSLRPGDRVVVAHHVPCFDCHYCRRGRHSMCRTFKESRLDPGGFAQWFAASSEHVAHSTFLLPSDLSLEAATFMEPLACALKALPRLGLAADDVAVVYGLGGMGVLFGRLLAAEGARVVGVDPAPARREFARPGLAAAFAPDDPELPRWVRDATEGRGADAAILVAGRGDLAPAALALLRPAGTLCLFAASPAESPVPLSLGMMYYNEIALFGSYSPDPEGLARALVLLAGGRVPVEDLVTHRLPLEETPKAFDLALRGEGIKIMIRSAV